MTMSVTFDSPLQEPWNATFRWANELRAVVFEVPLFWVPDLKAVPWLPHADDASRVDVNPDVMGSLGPVVDNHSFPDVLDAKFLASEEFDGEPGGCWVHEIVVYWVDLRTDVSAWISADALMDIQAKIVNDPHIRFDVGDIRGDVSWERFNVKIHT